MAGTVKSEEGGGTKFEAPVARIVLSDCQAALRELRAEPTTAVWRIRWVATLALLRIVREVLTKVDAIDKDIHPELRKAFREFPKRMMQTRPKPIIYWGFICQDANNILHQYKFSTLQEVTFREKSGQRPDIVTSATDECPLPEGKWDFERTYFMKTGPFAGRDQRDVVEEAIAWWNEEIGEMIDRAAAGEIEKILL